MPVTIRIFAQFATVKDYQWHCDDPEVQKSLNSTLHPDGPSGADPDPDYTAALTAMEMYGHGKIIEHVIRQRDEPTQY
jgi:hypothetical protein